MSEYKPFAHTEESAERLVERYNTLNESLTINHSPERLRALQRELSLVAFEIHQRIYTDESIQLEDDCEEVSIEELMANEL